MDSSIDNIVAWDVNVDSRLRLNEFFKEENGGVERAVTPNTQHSQTVRSVRNVLLKHRLEFTYSMIWKVLESGENGAKRKMAVFCGPVSNDGLLVPTQAQAVWTSETHYEELQSIGAVKQTRVLFFVQSELGQGVSDEDTVSFTQNNLMHLSFMRKAFDRSAEVDASLRSSFTLGIARNNETYTDFETGVLKLGTELSAEFDSLPPDQRIKEKSGSPLILFEVASELKGKTGRLARTSTNVRAPLLEVLAYLWQSKSRNIDQDTLEHTYLEETSNHSKLEYILKEVPSLQSKRDFLSRSVWMRQSDPKVILISVQKADSDLRPEIPSVFRGSFDALWRLTEISRSETKVEMTLHYDVGATLPKPVLTYYAEYQLHRVATTQQLFQGLRKLATCDERDGKCFGEALMVKLTGEAVEDRVSRVFSANLALREVFELRPFMPSMMTTIVRNQFKTSREIGSGLVNLTNTEASSIGEGLALALISNTTSEAAIDEWIYRYPALQELDEIAWFRSMMGVVATRISLNFGAKFRAYSGAAISLADMASDLYMVATFVARGETFYAKSIMATIILNTTFQLLIVVLQNQKMGAERIKTDVLTTIFCLKPAVDAWRVCRDQEKDSRLLTNAQTEMFFSRLCEIVCESLPSGVMQMYALVNSNNMTAGAMVSIFISSGCTAFASTSISWDTDTNPTKRRMIPRFYGFIRNDPLSRTITFVAMIWIATFHVMGKLLATSLLLTVNKSLLGLYMGIDMAAVFVFKAVRGDLRYWVNGGPVTSAIITFFSRFTLKVVTDFTAIFQSRHPFELGGLLWSLTLLINQVSCFVAVHLYLTYYEEELIDKDGLEVKLTKLTPLQLWGTQSILSGLFVISWVIFIAVINMDYAKTFFSTVTGKQFAEETFRIIETDEELLYTFRFQEAYYDAFEEELMEEFHDAWPLLMKDKPEWLTDDVISNVPDRFFPKPELIRLTEEGGGERRRSSAFMNPFSVKREEGGASARRTSTIEMEANRRRRKKKSSVGGVIPLEKILRRRFSEVEVERTIEDIISE